MMDKLNIVDITKTIRLEKIARVYSWVVSDGRKFSVKRLSRTQRNIKIMFQCAKGDKTIQEIAKENPNDAILGQTIRTIIYKME